MQTRITALTTTLVLGLSLVGASASAAPTSGAAKDPTAAARAGELFRAGRAAAAAGDHKTACEKFGESEKLQPAPGTQLNLGACEAKQGHLLAAREHFRKASSAYKPDDERRAVAANSANDVTDRLPTLTIHIAEGAPPDTQVTLEGAALDPKVLEHGIELDPGKTTLVVNASGRQPRSYDVDLAEAEKRDLTVDAGEPPPPPAAADATGPALTPATGVTSDDARATSQKLHRTLGYVGIGVGAAGIVTGSIFGILALQEASVVKSNCNASYACKPAGVSAASSGSTDGILSTTTFIAGAAFAAAGAYLVITTARDDHGPAAPPAAGSLTISPLALRSGGGATGTWTF